MNAFCKWWDKPLEEVEEDAQEVCLKEGRACTACSYLEEAPIITKDSPGSRGIREGSDKPWPYK